MKHFFQKMSGREGEALRILYFISTVQDLDTSFDSLLNFSVI